MPLNLSAFEHGVLLIMSAHNVGYEEVGRYKYCTCLFPTF